MSLKRKAEVKEEEVEMKMCRREEEEDRSRQVELMRTLEVERMSVDETDMVTLLDLVEWAEERFGLSPTECKKLRLMSEGGDLPEYHWSDSGMRAAGELKLSMPLYMVFMIDTPEDVMACYGMSSWHQLTADLLQQTVRSCEMVALAFCLLHQRLAEISYDHHVIAPSSCRGLGLGPMKEKVIRSVQGVLFQLAIDHPNSSIISSVEKLANEDLFVEGPISSSTTNQYMKMEGPRVWRCTKCGYVDRKDGVIAHISSEHFHEKLPCASGGCPALVYRSKTGKPDSCQVCAE